MKINHRKIAAFVATLCCIASAVNGQETNGARTLPELREQLEAHLNQPRFSGATWGVKIISLDTGRTLFEQHADRLMSPASNSKLYTGALALDKFGGDYQIETPIYATAKPNRSGTVRGDLIIVGHGDPSWNSRRLGTNFWEIFEPFVAALTNAGVRSVNGDIVADASFFHGPPTGASWTVDDLQESEAGEISALALNDNVAQIRVLPGTTTGKPCDLAFLQPATGLVLSNCTVTVTNGGIRRIESFHPPNGKIVYVFGQLPIGGTNEILDVSVPRPADWFAAALKEALARRGIKVSGKVRSIVWPNIPLTPSLSPNGGEGVRRTGEGERGFNSGNNFGDNSERAVKLGIVLSPPLREVIRDFMKPSQNLETDLVFGHVGEMTRDSNSPPARTSEQLAVIALHRFLAKVGVPSDDVHFDEGSGLSRNNLTTAAATVALLQHMATNRWATNFDASLPVAGVDGTLRRRMRSTPAAGNVHAKTGTLRWANALSGYVTSAAGEKLAFSIMLNRYVAPPGRENRDELDKIAVMLAMFAGHSTENLLPLDKAYSSFGQLIVTQLVNAPFPHPARVDGHTYQGKPYSAKEHYADSTVAIFVSKNFRATEKIDFVVHFHGWRNTVANTVAQFKLVEQLVASGKNAVLVVPEGPRNAPDSFGGKLEDPDGFKKFMDEVAATLRTTGAVVTPNFEVGKIILSGHSGGYHVISAIVKNGGLAERIKEVWLFDALYGGTENFVAWQKSENGRLLDIYTDHGGTKAESERLMNSLKESRTGFLTTEDHVASPDELRTSRLVFLHTNLSHNEVVAKRETFRQFLETSCLESR